MDAPVKSSKLVKGWETLFSPGKVIEPAAGRFTPSNWW
jgi:hypothetical protein